MTRRRKLVPVWPAIQQSRGQPYSGSMAWLSVQSAVERVRKARDKQIALDNLDYIDGMAKHMLKQVHRRVHSNPASRAAQKFISKKVSRLAHEGMPASQRVAAAYSMARQRGFKTNPRGKCAVIDYGKVVPSIGCRYVVQSLPDRPLQVPPGVNVVVRGLTQAAARAMADHLNERAKRGYCRPRQLVTQPNRGVLRKGRRGAIFQVRRNNPLLAVMGANPPRAAGEDIEATWAIIEYRRPDDPNGKRIVRTHEFHDGFVATPLEDGGILLRHPRGLNLWTRR